MRTTAPVSRHSIEGVIARVEKDKPSFHRDPILAVQLDAGSGNPSDCIVSGDRLPVTLSCLAI
jgi:hypothetical protein